jgi:hypothetical protein
VELHDDDPRDVARLIIWFYYSTYPAGEKGIMSNRPSVKEMIVIGAAQSGKTPKDDYIRQSSFSSHREQCEHHFRIYLLADKYDIPSLRAYCVDQLRQAIGYDPGVAWMLVDFTESAAEMDIKTDDVKTVVEEVFAKDPQKYIQHERFEARVKNSPDFAWALVKKLVGGGQP